MQLIPMRRCATRHSSTSTSSTSSSTSTSSSFLALVMGGQHHNRLRSSCPVLNLGGKEGVVALEILKQFLELHQGKSVGIITGKSCRPEEESSDPLGEGPILRTQVEHYMRTQGIDYTRSGHNRYQVKAGSGQSHTRGNRPGGCHAARLQGKDPDHLIVAMNLIVQRNSIDKIKSVPSSNSPDSHSPMRRRGSLRPMGLARTTGFYRRCGSIGSSNGSSGRSNCSSGSLASHSSLSGGGTPRKPIQLASRSLPGCNVPVPTLSSSPRSPSGGGSDGDDADGNGNHQHPTMTPEEVVDLVFSESLAFHRKQQTSQEEEQKEMELALLLSEQEQQRESQEMDDLLQQAIRLSLIQEEQRQQQQQQQQQEHLTPKEEVDAETALAMQLSLTLHQQQEEELDDLLAAAMEASLQDQEDEEDNLEQRNKRIEQALWESMVDYANRQGLSRQELSQRVLGAALSSSRRLFVE